MSINVILLSRRPDLYASNRLIEAAKSNECIKLHHVDPAQVVCQINLDHTFTVNIASLRDVDLKKTVVIPRISSICPEYSLFALQHLEACGCSSMAPSASLWISRNKFLTLQYIGLNIDRKQFGKIIPGSTLLRSESEIDTEVDRLGGYPVILKYLRGTSGAGVILATDRSSIKANLAALNQLHFDLMIQKYYPEAKEHDLRLLVLGNKVIASMKREPAIQEFRANFHQGANLEQYHPKKEEELLAIELAKLFKFEFCGVDLIGTKEGLKVLEINSSPGFEGIEQVNKAIIAEEILKYITQK